MPAVLAVGGSGVQHLTDSGGGRAATLAPAQPHRAPVPSAGRPMDRWTTDNTTLDRWFERDRAYVGLVDKDSGHPILDVWDGEVEELVEDGFLDPRDLHRSAVR